MRHEFERQIDRLIALGYPAKLGVSAETLRTSMEPLAEYLPAEATDAADTVDVERGRIAFVIVVRSDRMGVDEMLPLVEREGKTAFERLYPIEPHRFCAIESVHIPEGDAYLLLDVDRGRETLNATPNVAMTSIAAAHRTGLTIEEGIAILTHFPEFLQPNNCFSLLASRCGDKRVPALWLSKGRPRLGWCWEGNPHTWLGSASCGTRSQAVEVSTGESS